MRGTLALCGLASLLLAGRVMAADRPAVGPTPDWVAADAGDAAPLKASEAPLQVLLNDRQMRITTEAVESYVASRVKIQSPQGLGMMGTLSFAWNPDTDVLTLHKLTAVREGKVMDLLGQGDVFTILRREDQLEQSTLTGLLTAVLQPPGLQVGDVMDVSYTLRRKDPVIADSPGAVYVWPNASVGRARFRAIWPDTLQVKWRASSHMPAAEPAKRDGWMELDYRMENPAQLLQPTGAPPRFAALRMVELTTFADWQQLSRRLAPLYQKTSTLDAASPLRAEAARIRQQHATPAARAGAALQLVQDQIRYVLLAMNDGGLMPAAADETWKRRFGDCKAKTAMLLALLRELDIDAEPVAVSSAFGDGMDGKLPQVGLFDHVLVRAQVEGKAYWLDGTRTGDRVLSQIRPPEFIWALPLTAKGSALVSIPREPVQQPQFERSLEVDAREGVETPAPFRAEVTMRGDIARSVKRGWDAVPEESRQEQQRTFWRGQFHNLEIQSTDSRFDESLDTLTWKATGTIRLEWDAQYNTYEPNDMGIGYRADFSRPAGTDATAPYAVEFPVHNRTSETILLPPQEAAFTVTGTDVSKTIAGVEYQRTARADRYSFTATVTQRSVAPEFPASERSEAERALLELSRNDLYLKKPAAYLPGRKELLAEADKPLTTAAAYGLRGIAMRNRGLLAEALAAYDKSLELDPQFLPSLVGRADLQGPQGKFDAAYADLDKALQIDPQLLFAKQVKVRLLLIQGRAQEMIGILDPVIAAGKYLPDVLVRARAHLLLGNHELALRDASEVMAKDGWDSGAHFVKADALIALRRTAELRAMTDELTKSFESRDPRTYALGLAEFFEYIDEPARARAVLDKALQQTPASEGYLARARLPGSRADTLADLRRVLNDAGASRYVRESAVGIMVDRKWSREVLDELQKIERAAGATAESATLRGVAQWQQGDRAAAAAAFTEARKLVTQPMQLNNICWAKATRDVALEDALQDCDAAIAQMARCEACHDSRGFVLLRMGRFAESVAAYDTALSQRPGEAASHYGRGVARIRMGQKQAGEDDLRLARVMSPIAYWAMQRYGLMP